jgi:hypothetical protein
MPFASGFVPPVGTFAQRTFISAFLTDGETFLSDLYDDLFQFVMAVFGVNAKTTIFFLDLYNPNRSTDSFPCVIHSLD